MGRELQRDVGSERGPADHRRLQPEVVEQGLDLAREQRHQVEPQVLGAVGEAVAEQVDRDHQVALGGERRPEAVEQCRWAQAVDQHQCPLPGPVLVVGDPVPLVSELAHEPMQSSQARLGTETSPRVRSQGREARSAPSTARVAGARLSA